MPSSDKYQRDYAREYDTQKQRGESGTGSTSGSAKRHRLRRLAMKQKRVTKGQDVDHVTPLSKGGANTLSNARSANPSQNRSFPRNADGSMK
jgi:5-methylcytosine-specific restriction endonuclease McrA